MSLWKIKYDNSIQTTLWVVWMGCIVVSHSDIHSFYDDLHWVNDLDELDKTLNDYQDRKSTKAVFTESSKDFIQKINDHHSTNTKKSVFSSEEYYTFQQPCKVASC